MSISVGSLGIQAGVVPVLAAPGGALDIPADPSTFGWWSAGAAPSGAAGSVVLVAHIDAVQYGAGPMSTLIRAPMRTAITVVDSTGRVYPYTLSQRRSVAKPDLPLDLFTLRGDRRLVLVTCGGTFDRRSGHYSDNIILIATPA